MADTNTSVFNPSEHTKLYNSQQWEIYAFITDLYHETTVPLVIGNINKVMITNDIECYSPTISMQYIDFGFTLSKYFKANSILLDITFIQPKKDFESQSINLPNKFILNDIRIVSQTRDTIIYEFIGTHINSMSLIKNINYANNKEQGKVSPYQIIKNVLSKINYNFDARFIDTTRKIDFISSQSMSVKDIIDYCLHSGVSEYDPPTYFVHRLLDNTAMLLSQQTDQQVVYNPNNLNLQVHTDQGSANSDLANQAGNIISDITTGGIVNMKCLSTHVFNDYDHNNRKWVQKTYGANSISKLLADITNTQQERVFSPITLLENAELNLNYTNYEHTKIYNVFRDLEVGSSNLQFTTFGELSRDAGQYILLTVKNSNLQQNINGLWNIYRCAHIWEGQNYMNDIVCYRTINQKTNNYTDNSKMI